MPPVGKNVALFAVALSLAVLSLTQIQVGSSVLQTAYAQVTSESTSPGQTSAETKSFVFLVSADGFNKTKALALTVNEGDLVQIKFIYDDDAYGDNPHTIRIKGYGLEARVDQKQRTASLTFRATTSGSFKIVCANEQCEGHENLQGLVVEVKAPKGKSEEQKPDVKTNLILSVSFPHVIREGYELAFKAELQDVQGKSLVGLPVSFYTNSTWGAVKIGTGYTNESGVAILGYPPAKQGTWEFRATFEGVKEFEASSSEPVVKVLPSLTYSRQSEPMLDLRSSVVTLVGLVVASVWGTYAYVLSGLVRISKVTEKDGQDGKAASGEEERIGSRD